MEKATIFQIITPLYIIRNVWSGVRYQGTFTSLIAGIFDGFWLLLVIYLISKLFI